MYLDEGERDLLLDRVGALSSAGSHIALDHAPGFFATPAVTSTDDASGDSAAARFAALAAAASSDPSLTAPERWLAGHGWRAKVEEPAAMFVRHSRPVPAQLQSVATGAARRWMASAERA